MLLIVNENFPEMAQMIFQHDLYRHIINYLMKISDLINKYSLTVYYKKHKEETTESQHNVPYSKIIGISEWEVNW